MRVETGIYVKNSAEAVALYLEAFDLTLGYHVKNPDGSYFHSELCRGTEELFTVVESKEEPTRGRTVQVSAILDNEDAVKRAFALLSPGGEVEMEICTLPWSPCACVLTDRFGVWWYLSAPQHYPSEDYDPFAAEDGAMQGGEKNA